MICKICHGSGNHVTFKPLTFWTCLFCSGSGVWVQFCKPVIAIGRHQAKIKKPKKSP